MTRRATVKSASNWPIINQILYARGKASFFDGRRKEGEEPSWVGALLNTPGYCRRGRSLSWPLLIPSQITSQSRSSHFIFLALSLSLTGERARGIERPGKNHWQQLYAILRMPMLSLSLSLVLLGPRSLIAGIGSLLREHWGESYGVTANRLGDTVSRSRLNGLHRLGKHQLLKKKYRSVKKLKLKLIGHRKSVGAKYIMTYTDRHKDNKDRK